MRRLSSIFKPCLRPWIALGALAFVVAVVMVVSQDVHRRGEVPWLLVVTALPLSMGLFAHVRNAFTIGMADEAWIDGDDLLLKRADDSIRMPLANIARADAELAGSRVTLELCLPCTLGSRVRFFAPPHKGRDIGAELRRRIAEARRHA